MLLNEVDAALWDAAAESADSLAAATPPWAGESLAGTSQSDRPIGPLLARLRSSLELLTVAEPGLEDLLRTLVEILSTLVEIAAVLVHDVFGAPPFSCTKVG